MKRFILTLICVIIPFLLFAKDYVVLVGTVRYFNAEKQEWIDTINNETVLSGNSIIRSEGAFSLLIDNSFSQSYIKADSVMIKKATPVNRKGGSLITCNVKNLGGENYFIDDNTFILRNSSDNLFTPLTDNAVISSGQYVEMINGHDNYVYSLVVLIQDYRVIELFPDKQIELQKHSSYKLLFDKQLQRGYFTLLSISKKSPFTDNERSAFIKECENGSLPAKVISYVIKAL